MDTSTSAKNEELGSAGSVDIYSQEEELDPSSLDDETRVEVLDDFCNILLPLIENHNSLTEAKKDDEAEPISTRITKFFVDMVPYGPESEQVLRMEKSVKDATLRGDLQSIREQAIADREDLARHAEYMDKVRGMEFMTKKKLDAIPEPEPMKPVPSLQEVIDAKKAAGLSTFTSPNDELIIDAVDPETVPTGTAETVAATRDNDNAVETEHAAPVETTNVVTPTEDEALKTAEAVKVAPEEAEVETPVQAAVVEKPAGDNTIDKVETPVEVTTAPVAETTDPDKLPWWKRVLGLGSNPDTSQVAGVGPNGPLVEEEKK
jgi:hypothetical protein